ncbi:gene transfer agent family protein [Pararhizobium sp. DWP3-4]|uniref:gene transfer agent family protein n=1 Tax=Pararhizobium sp. DWP3-4 TaxID=2804565 RepID=UPI003CF4E5B8
MSRDATIMLPWADGDHTFRLGWGELELLQEACDAGPYVILNRLFDESWKIGDISNTLRLGLIGGGMTPGSALKLTRTYVEKRPPVENLVFAQAVLSAGCIGAPEERVGETGAPSPEAESDLTTSPTEN